MSFEQAPSHRAAPAGGKKKAKKKSKGLPTSKLKTTKTAPSKIKKGMRGKSGGGRNASIDVGFASRVEATKVELPEGEPQPWDARTKLSVIGGRVSRIDGSAKVSGRAKYTFDVALPGMLWAAVLRSPYPAATIGKIDVSPALKVRGVKAAIAVADAGDKMLFAGQDVAAVAAERPEQAREALEHIRVKYEERSYVTETMQATSKKAPVVHQGQVKERRTEGDEPGTAGGAKVKGNVRPLPPAGRGDVGKAFGAAKHVHEATYTTPVQTHSALETHGILVQWKDDQHLEVWCSTQSIFSVRDEMAQIFSLPPENVHVITEFIGGGFGAKFGASAPGSRLGFMAGQLAKETGAPVKLMCDRHDEQVCTGNRPDSNQKVKIASDASGKRLAAVEVVSHGTAGIATGAGVGRNAQGLYTKIPNVSVKAHDVFTNGGPGTAMRAPGHPQGAFAFELAIDELAAKMGVDPLLLRIEHEEHPVRNWQLEMGAKKFGWTASRTRSAAARAKGTRLRRGFGVATSIWGDFGRNDAAIATVRIKPDASIIVENGVQDIGGGIATVLAMLGAEVMRRPMETVTVRYGDSRYGSSVGSGGSQTTSSVTPAVRNALEGAKAQLAARAAALLGSESAADVTWDSEGTAHAGDKSISFPQLCKKIEGEEVVATARRPRTYGNHPRPFLGGAPMPEIAGVQFAEVEVDTWTGVVRARRMLALHDCGRVMNRMTTRSQINGGIILGTSYALMEQRVMDHDFGRMLNPNLESYKILGSKDTPEIEVEMTDVHAGNNSTGAQGIGEPATIPTAAAIACAVYDALGVPVRSLPLTPDKVLTAMGGAA